MRDRAALINGTADATMPRDDGWQFLMLGRIDRACRHDRAAGGGRVAVDVARPGRRTLRACGGYESFLRTYKGLETDREAAEFLVLDRLFPRSVVFALSRAELCLENLESSGQRAGFQNEAQRLLGRTRAELEYRALADVLDRPAARDGAPAAHLRAGDRGGHPPLLRRLGGDQLEPGTVVSMQLKIVHTTGFTYDGARAGVVQRGAADPADRARPDRGAHAGSTCTRRRGPAPTATTGAPR